MKRLRSILVFACLTIAADAAVTLNQIETFSALNGWDSGDPNPNPPAILSNSGPLGSGDSALQVTSNGGSGAGGRLVVFNTTLWTGDYIAQGILAIAADLRNSGSTALSMRIAFNGPGGKFVTAPSVIAAFSGWVHSVFDIKPGSLISAGGSNAAATMAGVTEMRILHSSTVDYRGAQISSGFLADNIQAVPEPAAAVACLLSGALLLLRKR
ncbi:MAG: hypothetical protein ABI162_02755 [Luteolibacter sp.]